MSLSEHEQSLSRTIKADAKTILRQRKEIVNLEERLQVALKIITCMARGSRGVEIIADWTKVTVEDIERIFIPKLEMSVMPKASSTLSILVGPEQKQEEGESDA